MSFDYNKLSGKVDDLEKTTLLMAKSMEDSNKIITELVGEMKEARKETQEHYRRQDKLMRDNSFIHKTLERHQQSFVSVEKIQSTEGCSVFNNFLKIRTVEKKRFDDKEAVLSTQMAQLKDNIDEMKKSFCSMQSQMKTQKTNFDASVLANTSLRIEVVGLKKNIADAKTKIISVMSAAFISIGLLVLKTLF